MALETLLEDHRCCSRWRVWWVRGRITPDHEVSLVDISDCAAQIEHTHPVRDGTILFLALASEEHQAPLKCRVVRTVEHRYEVRPTGEHEHIYRTCLEFLAPSEESQRLIDEYILTGMSQR